MKLGEKGFTLIELLMVTAVVALIANAAAMSTFQVLRNTESNRNKMTAVNQVQNAGYWISLDAQRAQLVEAESANETAAVSWDQSEYGTLESDDVLYFAFSGNGGWGSNIEAFHGDDPPSSFNYTIPQQYLTADFKMKFFVDFSSSDEYAYVDNIDISPGIFSDDCSSFTNWNNGARWNVVSGAFRGDGGGEASWYNADWQYRKEIIIDPAKVEADLFDFPVLISLPPDYNLANGAQNDGDDILFTNAGGITKLSHEIEDFDGDTGKLVAWVKVSSLSPSTDTILYMYYGNATVGDQQDAAGVWDTNFKGIWHLHQTTGGTNAIKDSTSNNNHGTDQGSPTLGATGKIDNGIILDGSNDYIYTANSFANSQEFTIEVWFKTGTASGKKPLGFENVQSGEAGTNWDRHIYIGTDGRLYFGCYSGATDTAVSTATYTDNVWHHAVGVRNDTNNTLYLYVDGSEVDTAANPNAEVFTGYWRIGSYKTTGWTNGVDGYFPGSVDEVRISATARSAEWIKTSYNSQSSPSDFYSVGAEEMEGSSSPSDRYLTMSTSLDLSSYAVAEGFPLTFEWTTWDESGGTGHEVTYSLADGKLIRSHSIGENPPTETQTYIAQYIDPANTSCNFTNGKLTFTVTATVGSGSSGISESRQFRVLTRPD